MNNGSNQAYELKSTFATLPNYLTLLRIVLVPFFVAFLLKHKQAELSLFSSWQD